MPNPQRNQILKTPNFHQIKLLNLNINLEGEMSNQEPANKVLRYEMRDALILKQPMALELKLKVSNS